MSAKDRIRGVRQIIKPGFVLGRSGLTKGPAQQVRLSSMFSAGGIGAVVRSSQTDNTINGITVTDTPTPTDQQVITYDAVSGNFVYRTTAVNLDGIGATQGDILYRNNSVWTVLAPGTNGQVLTSGGAAANPSWTTLTDPADGTVTTVSVVTANGVSGTVANPTTTPAITLTLGAITPSSVAASGTVTGSNLTGTNTGDQTITLTGDVTGSGTGSFVTTIAAGVVTEAMQVLADNTTNNVSSTLHGYAPKSPADATKFLNGAATPAWTVPGTTFAGCSALLSANQSITDNVYTTVLFDNILLNAPGDYSAATGRFTASKAGKYLVACGIQGIVATTVQDITVAIQKNGTFSGGTNISLGQIGISAAAATSTFTCVVVGVVSLNGTTDWIEIDSRVRGTGGSDKIGSGSSLQISFQGS